MRQLGPLRSARPGWDVRTFKGSWSASLWVGDEVSGAPLPGRSRFEPRAGPLRIPAWLAAQKLRHAQATVHDPPGLRLWGPTDGGLRRGAYVPIRRCPLARQRAQVRICAQKAGDRCESRPILSPIGSRVRPASPAETDKSRRSGFRDDPIASRRSPVRSRLAPSATDRARLPPIGGCGRPPRHPEGPGGLIWARTVPRRAAARSSTSGLRHPAPHDRCRFLQSGCL
jgi:hypothetical protein